LRSAAASVAALAIGAPAGAVTFNLINTGGAEAGTAARFGFEVAANYWSHVLTDNVTVNLQIGFQHLGPGILGSTGSTTGARLVQNLYGDLALDQTSALDGAAVAGLKPLTTSAEFGAPYQALDAITSAYAAPATRRGIDTSSTIYDNDGSANNVVMDVNTANLKALGVTIDDNGNDISNLVDGSITFSSDLAFDFHPNNGIADGKYDFVAVAIHEMGHALGFVSGVDTYDLLGYPNSPEYGPPAPPGYSYADLFYLGAFGSPDIGDYRVMSTLDLFRYSAAGLDWSVGANAFFSLDGTNQLFGDSRFSTGAFNGDGSQASHWIDNQYAPRVNPNCSNVVTPNIGIMNPTIGACEAGYVTGLDLAAFDAIGWDVNFDALGDGGAYHYTTAQAAASFTPEPSTWAVMILGLGAVGAAMRRRRMAIA
jgi:hypothetical protein